MANRKARLFKLLGLLVGVSTLGILIALAVYYDTIRPREEEIAYHEEAKFPLPMPPEDRYPLSNFWLCSNST